LPESGGAKVWQGVTAIREFLLKTVAFSGALIVFGIGIYFWSGPAGLVILAILAVVWIGGSLVREAIRQDVQSQLGREDRSQLERDRDAIDR
jgi:hypothetical protein